MIQVALSANPVQMKELKAAKLLRTAPGRALIANLLHGIEERFAVNVYDKLLALCGWVFEYIYEPVYQDDPWLLYEKNLHRFVAMFTWLWFNEAGGEAEKAIRQFQAYMRSLDESAAPLLFDQIRKPLDEAADSHPFELVLRFARGYRSLIIGDNARLRATHDGGRWILDLSASGLWSHLNHWGRSGKRLRVRCDASKPIEEIAARFTGDSSDPGIARARAKGHRGRLGWKLADPISFVNSRDHPSIQLADIVAGTTVAITARGAPLGFESVTECIGRHVLQDTILPDFDIIDLNQRGPAVNYLILYDLAQRAERGLDPHANLAAMYRAAEVSWVRGDFHAIMRAFRRERKIERKR